MKDCFTVNGGDFARFHTHSLKWVVTALKPSVIDCLVRSTWLKGPTGTAWTRMRPKYRPQHPVIGGKVRVKPFTSSSYCVGNPQRHENY
jgi:hypothetical protein